MATGIVEPETIIPVIACSGGDIKQFSESIEEYIEFLDKDNARVDTGGIENLPTPPDGTVWKYSVMAEKLLKRSFLSP